MNIEIKKYDNVYIAEITGLPGSPPVGKGKTKIAAICELFFLITHHPYFIQYIDKTTLSINNKPFKWCNSQKR